ELLADQVELAADIEGPPLAGGRHEVPSVDVGEGHAALDADIPNRAAEMEARAERAVHRAGLAAQQRAPFAEAGAVEREVEVEALGGDEPAALEGERAEPAAGAIGAGGLRVAVDATSGAERAGRRNVEIGLGQVDERLGVAELEVDAAVAHVDRWRGAHHRPVDERHEVPPAVLGLAEVEAG